MTECCTWRLLRQIAKYSHEREGKKRRQNQLIQQMIVTKYANLVPRALTRLQICKYFFDIK